MTKLVAALIFTLVTWGASPALAAEHAGREEISRSGYEGPATCENCHPGTVKKFLETVHWKHASRVDNVEGLDPKQEYGMLNRVYSMCNGNDVVNSLQVVTLPSGKTKFTGCDSCHMGDSLNKPGSSGPAAEATVDCLLCHSSAYDFSKRKPFLNSQGKVVMGQDRSVAAALAIGKPQVKNCMICHEAAGGGTLNKRGFVFTPEFDINAAKGMSCVTCHTAKDHRIPGGFDPNMWASDGVRISCADGSCHGDKPHKNMEYNRHTARIACQTCHIPRSGGVYMKDFSRWEPETSGFYEYGILRKEPDGLIPVYAWYNLTVANRPEFLGPKGSKDDKTSKIFPFKYFQGRAYFDRNTGKPLLMDMGPPMKNGDALAGVASAANTLGIASYDPVPRWQVIYFGMNHMVKKKGLSCESCHALNGVLNFKALGYSDSEIAKLTNPDLFFQQLLDQKREEW